MKIKKLIFTAILTVCMVCMSSVFGISALAETPETVNIPDANLKAAIINTLELSSGNITPDIMKQLTVLETPENDPAKKIKDLTGLEYAVNLEKLDLDYNKITDLTPIANLTNLKELDISYNDGAVEGTDGITDISCLEKLVNLERFESIGNQGITDYSVIANFTNLKHLNLSISEIEDISFVSGLTKLEKLYLSFNKIYNILPLQNLTSLQTLALGTNRLQDISVIANMTNLTLLDIQDNYIEDFTPILGLQNLKTLDVSRNFLSDEQMNQIIEATENAETVRLAPVADDSKKAELICLNSYSKEMKKGESFVLSATSFDGTALEGVTYATSNDKVATVSADGKVTAVGTGACYISVTHNGYTRLCTVTVATPDDGGNGGNTSGKNSNGLIIGVSVGVGVVVIAAVTAVVVLRKKKK